MALATCLADLLATKRISQQTHDRVKPVYDELVEQYEPRYGRPAAESMATEKALAGMELDAAHRARTALLQAKAQGTILAQARTIYAGGKYADGPINGKALLAHLVPDQTARGINNVEVHSQVLLNDVRRLNYDLLAHFRHNLLGEVRHKADLDGLTRALHGEHVDDLNLKEMADAALQTHEYVRSRFNAAGGRIPKLEGYAVAHNWDPYRVGQLTAEQFIDTFAPELDRAKMIDWTTGEPLSDGKLADVLRQVHDSVVTEGANKSEPGQAGRASSFANRHTEHRVLHFKDADAWSRVNDQFGTGTVLDALMAQWERITHETAAMEVLGPNPSATVAWMGDLVDQEAKLKGGNKDRSRARVRRYEMERVWDELTGANRRAVRQNLALFGSTVRNFETASKLGFSPISAMSDHATRWTTNTMSGMPIMLEMGRYLKQLNPLDGGTREWARRNLLVSQELAGRMGGLGRMHLDDSYGGQLKPARWDATGTLQTAHEVSRRLADAALRLNGLTPHTIASREAGAMQFIANLSFHGRDAFANLDPGFRALLDRHGIGEGKWEQLRATPMTDWRGKGWLLPDNIEDRALREQVQRALMNEVELGTPTAGAYASAMMKQGRPGTVSGEVFRGITQFKMFPVKLVADHAQRMMSVPNVLGKAKYAAAFFGSTWIMGALSVQLSELWHGRDPLPMDTWDFWKKAALRAGGLGVFGDVLNSSLLTPLEGHGVSEYGQSLTDLVAGGPQVTSIQNVGVEAGTGVRWAALQAFGSPESAAKAHVQFAKATRNLVRRETPALNTWYTNVAFERLLVDTLFEQATGDPDAVRKSYASTENFAKQQGNAYWAPPGAMTGNGPPMRAPNWGNVEQPPANP